MNNLETIHNYLLKEGYEDVTFQKIADRCGITRTTLYIYFKNKHEIFLGSLKEMLNDVEEALLIYVDDEEKPAAQSLKLVLKTIVKRCQENKNLFKVLLVYLIQLSKTGEDINSKVRRRVVRVRHHLTTILIRGIKNKEFRSDNIKSMNDMLYGIIEASIFRISVLCQEDISEINNTIDLSVESLLV